MLKLIAQLANSCFSVSIKLDILFEFKKTLGVKSNGNAGH